MSTYLDLPLTTSLTRLNSFSRLDHLYLLILKTLALIQKYFLDLLFSISSFAALHVGAYSIFSFSSLFIIPLLPDLVGFFFQSSFFHLFLIPLLQSCQLSLSFFQSSFFRLFFFLTNAKCKCYAPSYANEYHDRPYQCNMQPLCLIMSLMNFEPLTQMSIFSVNANTLSNINVMQVWTFLP